MTGLKNNLFLIFSILTLTLLTSCGAIVKSKGNKYLTEEKGAIPPEFGKEKNTLLFITHHSSYNKYLKKNTRKIYKGDYELVSEDEFKTNDKYEDLNKYRFVFDYNYISPGYDVVRADGSTRAPLYNVKKFRILDRKENKEYVSKITSSFWSKLQKVYLKKLNAKLMAE
ncbi:hypothetical protein GCM10022393_17580 [Aquimarina addita]|uniref:Lipoprotein n=1 Tax=Aquimarina addita TaxID=870485 RepID=A0ABP6UI99_9FLAO